MIEGSRVARLGDTVVADCGHTGNIASASSSSFETGAGIASIGDTTSGHYVAGITGGSLKSTVKK